MLDNDKNNKSTNVDTTKADSKLDNSIEETTNSNIEETDSNIEETDSNDIKITDNTEKEKLTVLERLGRLSDRQVAISMTVVVALALGGVYLAYHVQPKVPNENTVNQVKLPEKKAVKLPETGKYVDADSEEGKEAVEKGAEVETVKDTSDQLTNADVGKTEYDNGDTIEKREDGSFSIKKDINTVVSKLSPYCPPDVRNNLKKIDTSKLSNLIATDNGAIILQGSDTDVAITMPISKEGKEKVRAKVYLGKDDTTISTLKTLYGNSKYTEKMAETLNIVEKIVEDFKNNPGLLDQSGSTDKYQYTVKGCITGNLDSYVIVEINEL